MNIDKFITSLKSSKPNFVYSEPKVTRWFMLSYDQSATDLKGDFRYFIIAALHAAGATHIKSYVASTIIFNAPSTDAKVIDALNNWKRYLTDTFGDHHTFGLMMGALNYYSDNSPIFTKVSYGTIEPDFDSISRDVIGRFKNVR